MGTLRFRQTHIAIQTGRHRHTLRFRQTDAWANCDSDRQTRAHVVVQTDRNRHRLQFRQTQPQPHIAIQTGRHSHTLQFRQTDTGTLQFRQTDAWVICDSDTGTHCISSRQTHRRTHCSPSTDTGSFVIYRVVPKGLLTFLGFFFYAMRSLVPVRHFRNISGHLFTWLVFGSLQWRQRLLFTDCIVWELVS